LKKAGTTAMQINMKTLRSKLNRGIDRFRKLQATYTPAAIQALAKRVTPAEELAENVPLMLPSALTPAEQEGPGCVPGLVTSKRRYGRHSAGWHYSACGTSYTLNLDSSCTRNTTLGTKG
jgi:hypothetical protein